APFTGGMVNKRQFSPSCLQQLARRATYHPGVIQIDHILEVEIPSIAHNWNVPLAQLLPPFGLNMTIGDHESAQTIFREVFQKLAAGWALLFAAGLVKSRIQPARHA